MVRGKIDQVQVDLEEKNEKSGQRTVFHEMFVSDQLWPEEKTSDRLEAEGVALVAAG